MMPRRTSLDLFQVRSNSLDSHRIRTALLRVTTRDRVHEATTAVGVVVADNSKASAVVLHKARSRAKAWANNPVKTALNLSATLGLNPRAHLRHPRSGCRRVGRGYTLCARS